MGIEKSKSLRYSAMATASHRPLLNAYSLIQNSLKITQVSTWTAFRSADRSLVRIRKRVGIFHIAFVHAGKVFFDRELQGPVAGSRFTI